MGGILVISRPPGIFPPDLIPELELKLELDPSQVQVHLDPSQEVTFGDSVSPNSTRTETSGHKLVGIGVALLVPIFSAFLAILTRFNTTCDKFCPTTETRYHVPQFHDQPRIPTDHSLLEHY